MNDPKSNFNRNVLIGVDDSDNARRAVSYVGQMLADVQGSRIILLHVIPEPEADFFPDLRDRDRWIGRYRQKMTNLLETYRREMNNRGIPADDIDILIKERFCPSMAECILQEREKLRCDTIVVGRQGISRSEEFLFGSVSSKIVTHARNCTVWVVE
ncbi:MAG: universal stress protein [Desulfobacterales bacterium]